MRAFYHVDRAAGTGNRQQKKPTRFRRRVPPRQALVARRPASQSGRRMRRRCMPTVVDEWGSRPPQVHRTAGCRPVGPNPPLTMCGPAPVKDTSAHPTARLAQKRLRHAHLGKSCVSGRAGLILQDEHFAGRAFCKTGPDRILPPSPHSQSARAGEGPPNSARGCAWCAACDAFSRVSRRRSASRIPPTAATAYRDP
jgi:hypothetical protein